MSADRRAARLLACYLVIASLAPASPVISAPVAEAAGVGRVPVVLACEKAQGRGHWVSTGIVDMMQDQGWVEGRDLFVFEPGGDIPDLSVAARELAGYVREMAEAGGFSEVDIVAPGLAGLYARYCVERISTEPVRVRTLITVGSPHRGSFLAGVLKSAAAMVRYERAVAHETSLFDALLGRSPGISAVDLNALLEETPWESESQFVLERARLYEPLYHEYLMERHFCLPGLPLESWQETFAGWLARRYPQVWEARISGNGRETVTGLTAGYYELLSLEAARNGYAFRVIPRRDLVTDVARKVPDVSGPREFLLNCALRILKTLLYNSAVFAKSAVEEAVLFAVSQHLSPAGDPDDPLINRLVSESVLVNMGTSSSRRFYAVPANAYLARWNSSNAFRPPDTRYVSIAGRRPGIFRWLWPQLGPSDWFVEVDSAVAPQTPPDTVMVFDCRPATTSVGVLSDGGVKRALLGILVDPTSSWRRVDLSEGKPVRATISSWKPTEIRPLGPLVALHTGSIPEGWRLAAALADGTPVRLVPLSEGGAGVPDGGDLQPGGKSHEALSSENVFVADVSGTGGGHPAVRSIVLKLVPGSFPGEGFMDRVPELYDREVLVEVLVQTSSYDPVGPNSDEGNWQEEEFPLGSAEPVEPDLAVEGADDRMEEGGDRLDGGGGVEMPACRTEADSRESRPIPGEGRAEENDAPESGTSGREPLIVVTYRSKKTCHLVPTEEYSVPVVLKLEGPRKWVTGKPAEFRVSFEVNPPRGVLVDRVRFEPGPRFSVLWRRSGEFRVGAGVVVSLRVMTPEGQRTFTNVYVTEEAVSVLTPGITR